jgi:hypothetical protein
MSAVAIVIVSGRPFAGMSAGVSIIAALNRENASFASDLLLLNVMAVASCPSFFLAYNVTLLTRTFLLFAKKGSLSLAMVNCSVLLPVPALLNWYHSAAYSFFMSNRADNGMPLFTALYIVCCRLEETAFLKVTAPSLAVYFTCRIISVIVS